MAIIKNRPPLIMENRTLIENSLKRESPKKWCLSTMELTIPDSEIVMTVLEQIFCMLWMVIVKVIYDSAMHMKKNLTADLKESPSTTYSIAAREIVLHINSR